MPSEIDPALTENQCINTTNSHNIVDYLRDYSNLTNIACSENSTDVLPPGLINQDGSVTFEDIEKVACPVASITSEEAENIAEMQDQFATSQDTQYQSGTDQESSEPKPERTPPTVLCDDLIPPPFSSEIEGAPNPCEQWQNNGLKDYEE